MKDKKRSPARPRDKRRAAFEPPALPQEASEAERAAIEAFEERRRQRPPAPKFEPGEHENEVVTQLMEKDPLSLCARVSAATGATDGHLMDLLISQAARSVPWKNSLSDKMNVAVAALQAIGPRDEVEGMLAVQMVATHNLAMELLRRAASGEYLQHIAVQGNLAVKLLRTYAAQTEALARLRGKTGKQVVRVEHVHVESGGQAVVGAVTSRGGGGASES